MDDGLELTELLGRAQAGDAAAAEAVFRATYDDLRRIAHARLRSGGRNTVLDTTALVHEWFLRFSRTHRLRIEDRRHFMRYAARAMRSIIVDQARERSAERRTELSGAAFTPDHASPEQLAGEGIGVASDIYSARRDRTSIS